MHVAVNTPSGNIGRALCDFLLDAGCELTVLSRNPEKTRPLVDRGANLVEGSLDEPAALQRLFSGAESLFWLTPPVLRPDLHTWARETARLAARTASDAGIERAVVLSSAGAHSGPGTGPVAVLQGVEREFRAACDNCVILRPGYFMENFLGSLATIRSSNSIFLPVPPQKTLPMVATRDIANLATTFLLDATWVGQRVVGVHGPEDLTFEKAAEIISAQLGRTIQFVPVSLDIARQGFLEAGLPDFGADLYCELYEALGKGLLDPAEPRTAETTTTTDLGQFASQVLRPALGEAAAAS
jgi:uncharacterized protein YbjT (DUF2867 family)